MIPINNILISSSIITTLAFFGWSNIFSHYSPQPNSSIKLHVNPKKQNTKHKSLKHKRSVASHRAHHKKVKSIKLTKPKREDAVAFLYNSLLHIIQNHDDKISANHNKLAKSSKKHLVASKHKKSRAAHRTTMIATKPSQLSKSERKDLLAYFYGTVANWTHNISTTAKKDNTKIVKQPLKSKPQQLNREKHSIEQHKILVAQKKSAPPITNTNLITSRNNTINQKSNKSSLYNNKTNTIASQIKNTIPSQTKNKVIVQSTIARMPDLKQTDTNSINNKILAENNVSKVLTRKNTIASTPIQKIPTQPAKLVAPASENIIVSKPKIINNQNTVAVLPSNVISPAINYQSKKSFRGIEQKAKADTKKPNKFNLEASLNSEAEKNRQYVYLNEDGVVDHLKSNTRPPLTAHLNTNALPKPNFIKQVEEQLDHALDLQKRDGFIHACSCDLDQFNSKEIIQQFKLQGVIVYDDASPNCLCLENGNIVFSPKHDIKVKLTDGILNIAGGAIVLVMKHADFLAIYDLHQTKVAAVQAIIGKKVVKLHPGLLMALPKESIDDFDVLNKKALADIAYRNPSSLNMGTQVKGFLAEFSIPSAITKTLPLRTMVKSRQAQDRSKIDKMLIDSIALMEATSYAGPYHCSGQ